MKRLQSFFACCILALAMCSAQAFVSGSEPDSQSQLELCRKILNDSIVNFYLPACVDAEYGGYLQEVDDNNRFHGDEKFLTLQARQLWFFSRLAKSDIRRQESLAAARSGYEFIHSKFLDSKFGGYYSRVTRQGEELDTRKHVYLNAFAIYAFVEFYRATGDAAVLKRAMELFQCLDKHAHDNEHSGYNEFFHQDWTLITDPKEAGYVGAIGVKTYNSHLHLMEAFAELYRETRDPLVGRRLEELIRINTETVKHPQYACNIDAWRPDWSIVDTPANLRASYGHDIECAWLVLVAVNALGLPSQAYQDWAKQICEYSIQNGYDTQYHGFWYSGPLGKPADNRKKEWWVQSESLVAMLTMHRLTGDARYRKLFDETLEFVSKKQVHPKGSWWATLSEDGSASDNRSRTSMWQGGYHNGRAMLVSIDLLKSERDENQVTPIKHSMFIAGPSFTGILDEDGQPIWDAGRAGARDGYVLPSGNILIAWADEVVELRPNKEVVLRYTKSAENGEIGTAQRLADGHTLVTELGAKPRLLELDGDGKTVLEVPLQPETSNAHMQTRMARKLSNGNYLVPHLLAFAVKEYDRQGKVVKTFATDLESLGGRAAENWPFTAIRLENGNTVINLTHGNKTVEVDADGKVVWSISNDDFAERPFADPCGGQRLPNGNTVIASYGARGGIKAFEVTPEKKIVWKYEGPHNIHELQILTTNGVRVEGEPLK